MAMKYGLLLLSLIFTQLSAQNKNDFIWLLGTPNASADPFFGGNLIDFEEGNPKIDYKNLPIDMWYPAVISDEMGQLSCYANGCNVFNSVDELIENGGEINAGVIYESYCNDPSGSIGYPSYQGTLMLPYPGHLGQYFYFHHWVNEDFIAQKLLYSIVDMNALGGLGEIVLKNQVLSEDTFSRTLTATRHANGRDWWIIASRDSSAVYFTYRLDPYGIHGPITQEVDQGWIPEFTIGLASVFSPDGTKFVRLGGDAPADFMFYSFDRCSGQFYNPIILHLPDSIIYGPWACFSPNSRFLYIQNGGDKLYQFDTWAVDISASVQLIGLYDGFKGRFGLSTRFNSMTMGPDQRIYMSCRNGANYVHVIHYPDSLGLACGFRQHDVELPASYPFYLPNMPFYRLYNIVGSECDSLGTQPPVNAYWRCNQDSSISSTKIKFTDLSYANLTQWNWSFGDGFNSTEQNPAHVYGQAGTYNVCLQVCNAQGFCDTLCKTVEVTAASSYTTQEMPSNIKIYPNPVLDFLIVEFSASETYDFIRVFDVNGLEVSSKKIAPNVEIERLDLENISSGLYFLELCGRTQKLRGRFVKTE